MSDDPKKEPSDAPRRVVLSGVGMVTAAGDMGVTHGVALSGTGAVTTAGDIGVTHGVALSGAGVLTAAGEMVVVHTVREVIAAIRGSRSEIVVSQQDAAALALATPNSFTLLVALVILVDRHASHQLASKGLSRSYNIEHCQTLSIKSFTYSNCLKLTKPAPEDAVHP
jgi:hypothetical protein